MSGQAPLEGLEREYRFKPPRAQLWFARLQVLLALSFIVINVQENDRPWTIVLWGAVIVLSVLGLVALRRTRTTLHPEGVRAHNGLTRPRLVRWQDITAVRVQGRYDDNSVLRRRNGRDVKLLGMPPEAVQQLAGSLDDLRESAGAASLGDPRLGGSS